MADASRDVRQMGLVRVAMNGSDEAARRWSEERQDVRTADRNPGLDRHELRAAQMASLEALGFRVKE